MLKVAWSPHYILPLPPNHRFPMSKYEVLPQQLLHEGTLTDQHFFSPQFINSELLHQVHTSDYIYRLENLQLTPQEIRRTGFPLTQELILREKLIAGGTVACTAFAVSNGVAMNIAGGTHHAFTNKGEGFCLYNDIALGAMYVLQQKWAKQILVIDLDVHQGNGTAEIFRKDNRVFTFSMHGQHNYPLQKEESDLDIGLPDGTSDKNYLYLLEKNLETILNQIHPQFIFFQSGVDVLATDKLGRLALTREGCKQRDKIVFQLAKKLNIPVVASMGGGYSPDFRDIIEAHANTYRLAQEIFF
ncbi:MAG: histone deacetylase [Cyclobacteriaceae bacterium]|jgi:acetoin utilization deacetylase AcuC-like enzyme|nr:histone deacetylase [Cyclobacteriaceae bacterium]